MYKILSLIVLYCLYFCGMAFCSPVLHENTTVTRANTNAYLEVDIKAFAKNIEITKKIVGDNVKICAVIKSDAYGAGIINVLPILIAKKIPCVAIASNEEARVIRKIGYQGQILRIRTATLGEIQDAMQYNVTETIGNLTQAKALDSLAKTLHKQIAIHLALNSGGMDRNGIDVTWEQGKKDALEILALPNLSITGLMSHSPYDEISKVQHIVKQFEKDTTFIITHGKLDRKKLTLHLANSYGAIQVPEARYDMVRPGKLIYGYGGGDSKLPIQQVMSLKSIVATINTYPKGSSVSYDGTHILKRDSLLANIPMGYYDGYAKSFSNQGKVLIRGHKVPIVGRVTKNTFMVDITDYPDIQAGDEVVLFGKQCGNEITQAEIEMGTGTILSESLGIWGSSNPIFIKDYNARDICSKNSM